MADIILLPLVSQLYIISIIICICEAAGLYCDSELTSWQCLRDNVFEVGESGICLGKVIGKENIRDSLVQMFMHDLGRLRQPRTPESVIIKSGFSNLT